MTFPLRLSDLLTILQKLETTVHNYFERRDISHDNVQKLRRLERLYKRAREITETLHLQSLPHLDYVTKQLIDEHATTLQLNAQKLASMHEAVETATASSRVKRMEHVLDECAADVEQFFQLLSNNVSSAIIETHHHRNDHFVRANNVPRNPPRLTLNYDSPSTAEGQLKAAVLKQAEKALVSVVANGIGGVGKTCALQGLANDKQVNNRFPDGILYIQLRYDAQPSDLITQIANLVRRTGGSHQANELSSVNTLKQAADMAYTWFRPHSVLVLVDDIWWANGIDGSALQVLATMVNDDSRLVYSTRDRRFLRLSDDAIEFSPKESHCDLAREMLMTHAGFDWKTKLKDENERAVSGILDICQGLPLAFEITGTNVRKYCSNRIDGAEDGWVHYYDRLASKREIIVDGCLSNYGHMRRIVDTSLDVLDSESGDEKFHERFRALCVLQPKQIVPIRMLKNLWGLEGAEETEKVVEKLDEVSVVRKLYWGTGTFMQLHDLVLNIAVCKSSDAYEVQSYLRTMICNYVTEERKGKPQEVSNWSHAEKVGKGEDRKGIGFLLAWCNTCFGGIKHKRSLQCEDSTNAVETEICSLDWWDVDDDGYIHDNVCQALRRAGYYKQLMWLLSKPQWIVKRLQKNGIYEVEQDLENGKAVAKQRHPENKKIARHMEVVGKAARMGCSYVSNNKREAWFQIHGRLLWYATQCEKTRKFVKEIEEVAPRPWAKASIGLLQHAGGAASDILQSSGTVVSVFQDRETMLYFWKNDALNIGVSRYFFTSGLVQTQAFKPDEVEQHNLSEVESCAFSPDGKKLLTGHRNGKMCLWETETGRIIRCINGHSRRIASVAISGDGSKAVSGSWDTTVRLWDMDSLAAVGESLVGHTKEVQSVAISHNGRWVVSGSWDKTVHLWNADRGETEGNPFVGHAKEVECVATSRDGRVLVSCSRDTTVRVWDADSGEAVGQPLQHGHIAACVAISQDGRRVVSGSYDKTIGVWDVDNSGSVGRRSLVGHTEGVMRVSINDCGTRVVSGDREKMIRVWNVDDGDVVEQSPVGHTGLVKCVAVCRDGSKVVSGSVDRTVRVWDCDSGEAVGTTMDHGSYVHRLAVNHDGSQVVSYEYSGLGKLWDVNNGRRVTTSEEEGWQSTLNDLALSESNDWSPTSNQVIHRGPDERDVVLATCDCPVERIGECWFSPYFAHCTVVRDTTTSV